jgi:hypothetical protein
MLHSVDMDTMAGILCDRNDQDSVGTHAPEQLSLAAGVAAPFEPVH